MEEILTQLVWQGFIGSLLPSIGFGVLFNVRGNSLLLAGLTGGVGGLMYQFSLYCGISDTIANFIAAATLSVCGEIFARKMKTTVSTFTAVALIPLVPGGGAFEMMVEFSRGNTLGGLMKAVHVLSVSGMLCLGILTVSTLTRFFFYSKRKIANTHDLMLEKTPFGHVAKTSGIAPLTFHSENHKSELTQADEASKTKSKPSS